MIMNNWTRDQLNTLYQYLTICIKNSYRCNHCANNHNGVCFFAAECFQNDFNFYNEEEEEINETFEPGRPYWNEMEANP